jgi:DNA-binding PadR family transcriptional regulator
MAELEPRNFLQPCLLLLLMEQPDHGYDLAVRLRPMHDGEGDPGSVYRALRGLERQGLVRSEWNPSSVGPARRTYYITDDGVAGLVGLADGLRTTREAVQVFLDRYARLVADGAQPGQAQPGHDRPGQEVHDDRHADGHRRPGGVRAPGRPRDRVWYGGP